MAPAGALYVKPGVLQFSKMTSVILSVALSDAIAPPAVPKLKTLTTLPLPLRNVRPLIVIAQLLITRPRPKIATCQLD